MALEACCAQCAVRKVCLECEAIVFESVVRVVPVTARSGTPAIYEDSDEFKA